MSVTGAGGASQIRRHHTISITPNRAASSSRNGVISEEPQEGASGVDWPEDDDDYVQEDWQAPTIGSVGDGSKGLHRQASLPTTYNNRGTQTVFVLAMLNEHSLISSSPRGAPSPLRRTHGDPGEQSFGHRG